MVFYVLAAIWGMGDAVIETQINALYGCLFTENTEAAFANYRLWESFGFMLTYAYNDFLCADVKLYICGGFLVVGMACYSVVEITERRRVVTRNSSVNAANQTSDAEQTTIC
ncbi:protein unc-93 homolog A-like [Gigantopelta aegis]|uniref:protein unc-93 homolog A-like n=1 Tax=Gigantopelta aegis TaxID=1735272 RepID=UPI001B88A60E|nr:protein unc-93 homolog A-like [Gigantopelta aegis]